MKLVVKCLWALVVVTTLSACLARSIGVVPSSRPLPSGAIGTRPVHGSSCQYYLLGVLPVSSPFSTQDALKAAKRMGGVDALTDITIDEIASYYILFSSHCVYVEGLGVVPERKQSTRRGS